MFGIKSILVENSQKESLQILLNGCILWIDSLLNVHSASVLKVSTIIYFSAECGDYVVEDYPDHTYLSTYKFVPHQDSDLEVRIMENHKKHV